MVFFDVNKDSKEVYHTDGEIFSFYYPYLSSNGSGDAKIYETYNIPSNYDRYDALCGQREFYYEDFEVYHFKDKLSNIYLDTNQFVFKHK